MMKYSKATMFLLLFVLLFTLGCEDNHEPEIQRGEIVSSKKTLPLLTAENINQFLPSDSIHADAWAEYNIEAYSVQYYTIDVHGKQTIASGAIYVPLSETDVSFPLASVHHGTIFRREDVASVNPYYSGDGIWIAGNGFVVACPDGLGLGVSDGIHPYIHAKGSAEPVVDFLRACRTFVTEKGIELNGQLFLAGYSEGGYVTMATHKTIEENYADEFQITASAPMAGPYDIEGWATTLLSWDTYDQPACLGYVFMTYNTIYDLNNVHEVFQSPYAEKVPFLYDGTLNGDQIRDSLTIVIADLFQPSFIEGFTTNPEHELRTLLLEENTLLNWAPEAPIQIYHGSADVIVPYSVAEITANALNITLVTFENRNHSTAAIPSISEAILWLESYVTLFAENP